jgi:tetratricopeptide (TPR) repeat protein
MTALVARNDTLEAKSSLLTAENELLEEQAQKREMVGGLIAHFMRDTFGAIAKLSGSQNARESLINVSLQYIDKLRIQSDNNPSMQRLLAKGLLQAGINQWSMTSGNRGRMDDAIASYEEAIAIADALRAQDAEDLNSIMVAVRGRLLLHNAYRRQGRPADQARMLDEAEPLLADIDLDTAPIDYVRAVLGIRLKRSSSSVARPDKDPTLISLLSTVDQVLERFPEHPAIRRDATIAWNYAGYAWSAQGEHERALEQFQRSIRFREELLKGAEDENTARRDILLAHRYATQEVKHLRRLDEVSDAYELEIVPLARALAADSPDDIRARTDLAKVLKEHGETLAALKRSDDALKPLVESHKLLSKAIAARGGDISADYWTTENLLDLEVMLAQAYLAGGQVEVARELAESAVALGRNATLTWPDQELLRGLYNKARRTRAKILEQLP